MERTELVTANYGWWSTQQISVSLNTSRTPDRHGSNAFRIGMFAAINFETATSESSPACTLGHLAAEDRTAVDGFGQLGSW